MIKMIPHKWLLLAVCLCLGARAGVGGPLYDLKQLMDEAKQNSRKYSERIKWSSEQVNQLLDDMDNNRDGSSRYNYGDSHEDAMKLQNAWLAAYWLSYSRTVQLVDLAEKYWKAAMAYSLANPGNSAATADVKQALSDYEAMRKWANNTSDQIWKKTNYVRGQEPGQTYVDAPIKIERAKLSDLQEAARTANRDSVNEARDNLRSTLRGMRPTHSDNCPDGH